MDIAVYQLTQLPWRVLWIYMLRLEAAERTFNHYVISPAAFAVDALPDVQILQKLLVFIAGELATLV